MYRFGCRSRPSDILHLAYHYILNIPLLIVVLIGLLVGAGTAWVNLYYAQARLDLASTALDDRFVVSAHP